MIPFNTQVFKIPIARHHQNNNRQSQQQQSKKKTRKRINAKNIQIIPKQEINVIYIYDKTLSFSYLLLLLKVHIDREMDKNEKRRLVINHALYCMELL